MEHLTNVVKFLNDLALYPIPSSGFSIRIYIRPKVQQSLCKINLRKQSEQTTNDENWAVFWLNIDGNNRRIDKLVNGNYEVKKLVIYSHHIEIQRLSNPRDPEYKNGFPEIVTKLFGQWLLCGYRITKYIKEITITDYAIYCTKETEGRLWMK